MPTIGALASMAKGKALGKQKKKLEFTVESEQPMAVNNKVYEDRVYDPNAYYPEKPARWLIYNSPGGGLVKDFRKF